MELTGALSNPVERNKSLLDRLNQLQSERLQRAADNPEGLELRDPSPPPQSI